MGSWDVYGFKKSEVYTLSSSRKNTHVVSEEVGDNRRRPLKKTKGGLIWPDNESEVTN